MSLLNKPVALQNSNFIMHERCSGERYNFDRDKFVNSIITKNGAIQMIFPPSRVDFRHFPQCMYVCMFVCKQVTRLSQQIFEKSKQALENILVMKNF